MPVYEYRCEECSTITEIFTGITQEKKELRCSKCGSPKINKIFSKAYISTKDTSTSEHNTCCGRAERCDKPPCSEGGRCSSNCE